MGEVRERVARASGIAAPRTLRHLASERRQRLARARPKQKATAGKQPAPLRKKRACSVSCAAISPASERCRSMSWRNASLFSTCGCCFFSRTTETHVARERTQAFLLVFACSHLATSELRHSKLTCRCLDARTAALLASPSRQPIIFVLFCWAQQRATEMGRPAGISPGSERAAMQAAQGPACILPTNESASRQ